MAKTKPAPSRADLLAEASAIWAQVAPTTALPGLRAGIDHTAETYAEQYGLSRMRAQSYLARLVEEGTLKRGLYRLAGVRQARYVYWPVGVAAPDDGTLPTE